jgi:hypothetical protein
LKKAKNRYPQLKIFNYNNDDAFSKAYPFYFWKLYLSGIKHYDHVFCYRAKNIDDLRSLGYKSTSLLLPYYNKSRNFEIDCAKTIDVVFIGHFENDGRDDYIVSLIKNNINIQLFGTLWAKSKHFAFLQEKLGEIKRLDSVNYNLVLNKAKIGLVFLSKNNNDDYTRRCFEIPMTNCVLLSERTHRLSTMFKEYESIAFFETKDELVSKVKWLLNNPDEMARISYNAKVYVTNGFEVQNRIKKVLEVYTEGNN